MSRDNRAPEIGRQMLEVLHHCGVRSIFSSPGSEWPPLWEALVEAAESGSGPAYYNARHEELAVAAAVGHHWVTGELPVLVLHTTVGVLHAAMAIRMARRSRIPLLILAGESSSYEEPPADPVGTQWLANLSDVGGPAGLAQSFVKKSQFVTAPELIPGMLEDASRTALTPPYGPVLLSLAMEHMLAPARPYRRSRPVPHWTSRPDAAALDEVAERLCGARNPLILTTAAGRRPDRVVKLVALAETLAIPVVEPSRPAFVNFPRDHYLHQGFDAAALLQEADVVVLASCLLPWSPPSARPAAVESLILLDDYPTYDMLPYWGVPIDVCIGGDLGEIFAGLCRRVASRGVPAKRVAERAERWRRRHRQLQAARRAELEAVKAERPIDGRWLSACIASVFGEEAVVVDETITDRRAVLHYAGRVRPGTYFSQLGGGLGLGLGVGLGVQLANPEVPVVTVMGDGAFQYNPVLAAMGFAQEYRLPFFLVLYNDRLYSSQKKAHVSFYPQGRAVQTGRFFGPPIEPTPDYAALSPAYGGWGMRVEDPDQVLPALEEGWRQSRRGKFCILDVHVKP